MVLRVLFYILSFYMDYTANYKRIQKLPPIFPIVLYNGQRTWTASMQLSDLIAAEPSLGAYAIAFQCLLLNEKAYSKEQLLTIRNIVSTLFLAEGHYDITLLEQELLNLYDHEPDKQAVSLFLNWFRQLALYGKVSPDDYEKLDTVYRTKEEVQTMLVATLREERKKAYQDGEAAGIVKGLRQTLLKLLQHRFGLNEAAQLKLAEQLTKISEMQTLNALTDHGLQVESFEEFATQLGKYLPPDLVG